MMVAVDLYMKMGSGAGLCMLGLHSIRISLHPMSVNIDFQVRSETSEIRDTRSEKDSGDRREAKHFPLPIHFI